MKANKQQVVERLVQLLEDPKEVWEFSQFVAYNDKRGIEIWTANVPILNINFYPVPIVLGLIAKWKIWRAVQTAYANCLMRRLEGPSQ